MPLDTVAAGQKIAAEAMAGHERDPRDVLNGWGRDFVGATNVRINLPLRDPVECRRHLRMIEDVTHRLSLLLEGRHPDYGLLHAVRGEMRVLNQKVNAYRAPKRD